MRFDHNGVTTIMQFSRDRGVMVCHVQMQTTGVARRNPTDVDDNYLAMKLALTRAIKPLPREIRAELWRKFHEEVGA